MLVFYTRLMEGLTRNYQMRIWIGFGVVGATFAASAIVLFSACRPFPKYWQINPDPGSESCNFVPNFMGLSLMYTFLSCLSGCCLGRDRMGDFYIICFDGHLPDFHPPANALGHKIATR